MDGRNAGCLRQVRSETSNGAGDVYGANDASCGPTAPDASKDGPGLLRGERLRRQLGTDVGGDHRGTRNGV